MISFQTTPKVICEEFKETVHIGLIVFFYQITEYNKQTMKRQPNGMHHIMYKMTKFKIQPIIRSRATNIYVENMFLKRPT